MMTNENGFTSTALLVHDMGNGMKQNKNRNN